MLLRLYNGTGIATAVLIFITAVCLWTGAFLNPALPAFSPEVNTMPLYGLLTDLIGENALPAVIFSFLLVSLMTVLLTVFNTSVFFISERTFLPAVLFVFISGIFPVYQTLNPAVIASVFLLLALIRLLDAYMKNGTAYSFFDAALLIGFGSLFYASLIWFGLIVFLGLIILRTSSMRELFLVVFGIVTPYLFLYAIYFILNKNLEDLTTLIYGNLFGEALVDEISKPALITLLFFGVIMLIAIFHLFSEMNKKKIKSRKTFSLLLWILLLALVLLVFLPSSSLDILYLLAIPTSYIGAHYFVFMRKKMISDLFFTALAILIVLIQILYYSNMLLI